MAVPVISTVPSPSSADTSRPDIAAAGARVAIADIDADALQSVLDA